MAVFIPLNNIPIQLEDLSGLPLVSGTLEFFLAGTTTPTDLFADETGTSIGETITLNSWGMPSSGGNTITLFRDQSIKLKIVGKNAAGATIFTSDNIPAVASFDSASSTKVDFITVTQAVNLDTMESQIATNVTAIAAIGDTDYYGSMFDSASSTAFVINAQTDSHCVHTVGMAVGSLSGWTFDAGGGGTSFPIASIANGADAGVDIAVTTTGSHLLAVNDIVSQTNLTSSVYTGIFKVKAIISSTIFEVAAVYTATDTGTMDAAASLVCVTAGTYRLDWSASIDTATTLEEFDYSFYLDAAVISGSVTRHNAHTNTQFSSIAGTVPKFAVVVGEKISMVIANNDSGGNIVIRNLVVALD